MAVRNYKIYDAPPKPVFGARSGIGDVVGDGEGLAVGVAV